MYLISKHLKYYKQPKLQRHIIRILFMVPIYAVDSWVSLKFVTSIAMYVDTLRDCYEAFVIYSFVELMVMYKRAEEPVTRLNASTLICPLSARFVPSWDTSTTIMETFTGC